MGMFVCAVCVCVCAHVYVVQMGVDEKARDLPSQAPLTHMASEACASFNCTASSQVGGRVGLPIGRCLASQVKMSLGKCKETQQ